jgi:cyclase
MYRPRVIPVLLLKHKGLVKTVCFKNPKYIGDPINAVRIFNDLEADELVFLDITATIEKRTIAKDLIKKIGDEAFMPFAVGGGIKTITDIRELLNAGAEKVVINTAAIENPSLIKEAALIFGNQSLILSVDVKKNIFGNKKIYVKRGRVAIKRDIIDYCNYMVELGIGEILINSIDRDGTMNGYDLELIRLVSESVKVPVIAVGGAGKLEDMVEAVKIGKVNAVAAGSLFVYHGPRKAVLINYPDKEELKSLFKNIYVNEIYE